MDDTISAAHDDAGFPSPASSARPNLLILSRHDYRSPRKASVHFIARELARSANLRFASIGMSLLSRIKGDPRLPLWNAANRIETVDGVDCYLWRSLVHPCKTPAPLAPIMDRFYAYFADNIPTVLRDWIVTADTVFVESGGPEMFIPTVRRLAPRARLVYLCADTLDVVGSADYLVATLMAHAPKIDWIVIKSKRMAPFFPPGSNLVVVPQGIDKAALAVPSESPYAKGTTNLASVGNMLFDPAFFTLAAPEFPEIDFHVIGGGPGAANLDAPNIVVHAEMPFAQTLPYLQHADAGVAPYGAGVVPYLADSSLKLAQYGGLGLPGICPEIAAAGHAHRFGYTPGDKASIVAAIEAALAHGRFAGTDQLGWEDVARRVLAPQNFPDTRLPE